MATDKLVLPQDLMDWMLQSWTRKVEFSTTHNGLALRIALEDVNKYKAKYGCAINVSLHPPILAQEAVDRGVKRVLDTMERQRKVEDE